MEELNICTLFIQTSLPPNHPTSLKVKNVHNFAIFQWICMKLCMETLNVKTFSFSLFRRRQKPKFIVLSHFLIF